MKPSLLPSNKIKIKTKIKRVQQLTSILLTQTTLGPSSIPPFEVFTHSCAILCPHAILIALNHLNPSSDQVLSISSQIRSQTLFASLNPVTSLSMASRWYSTSQRASLPPFLHIEHVRDLMGPDTAICAASVPG